MLSPGDSLGPYTLSHRLGEGGMAEVWAARHVVLGLTVALKLLYRGSPALFARLKREGRVQAALHHDNILPVHDVIDVRGTPGLVLPLVDGPALDDLMAIHRFSEAEAVAIFTALLYGMAHAHRQGLVHRDLKPGNVLLSLDGGWVQPRIADFGLVKEIGVKQTVTGAVFGTPAYAPPEQLRDAASVDARSDIFSLGVLFAELLTGRRPYPGTSLVQIIEAHQEPPDLSGIPAAYAPLVAWMVAADPAERPPDCAAILARMPPADPRVLAEDGPLYVAAWSRRRSVNAPPGPAQVLGMYSLLSEATPLPEHNLPAALDDFIGRQEALRELAGLVDGGTRLVNVVGVGGSGKTRLVQQFGHDALARWPGGVWFCDLSEARDLAGLCFVVGGALGLALGGGDASEAIAGALAKRGRCLLILDNFEHLVDHADGTAARWHRQARECVILVTSRAVLGVAGEQVLPLSPLQPDDAAALFVARARQRRQQFSLTADNRESVQELVALLDGLPLAIELAAARVGAMTPAAMVGRMGQRFRLLRPAGRASSVRRATMRGAIDWSWNLLSDWEQAAFAQCSVFEGGFTLEAAEAVIDLEGFVDEDGLTPWTLDAIQSLVDKSLLHPLPVGGDQEPRFGMYLTLQSYATEKLADGREAVGGRHSEHYAHLGARLLGLKFGVVQDKRLWWRLVGEVDNLLAATDRSMSASAHRAAAECALAVSVVLNRRGPFSRASGLLTTVLKAPTTDELVPLHSHLHNILGNLHLNMGDVPVALACYQQALALAEQVGQAARQSVILGNIASIYRQQGDHEQALSHYEQALVFAEQTGDRNSESFLLSNLGSLNLRRGNFEAAERHFSRALTLARMTGNNDRLIILLGNLGLLRARLGQPKAAEEAFLEVLQKARELQLRRQEAVALINLGDLAWTARRIEDALTYFEETLEVSEQIGFRHLIGVAHARIGLAQAHRAEATQARASLAKGEVILRAVGDRQELGLLLCSRVELERGEDDAAADAALAEAVALRDALKLGSEADLSRQLAALGAG